MKKIIVVLFACIFMMSLSACSDSPEQIYGIYKNTSGKIGSDGYLDTITIAEDEIVNNHWGSFPFCVKGFVKKDNCWIGENVNEMTSYAQLNIIDENTLEYILVWDGEERAMGTYQKITMDEYKAIKKNKQEQ